MERYPNRRVLRVAGLERKSGSRELCKADELEDLCERLGRYREGRKACMRRQRGHGYDRYTRQEL